MTNNPQGDSFPLSGVVSSSAPLTWLRHAIVIFVIAFASQVTIGGQSVNLADPAGRSAAVAGILSAIWVTVERVFLSGNSSGA